ncbi:MAG: hypothetical protein SFY66_04345 [Oculatellaceae cyanobacterium bins.114]|nr:hypothetical protein [Oculatellaceae cyanobacterium bins.114]
MVNALRVPKQYGTYADICLMLGLARLAYIAQLQIYGVKEIKLADLGTSYQIQLKQDLDPNEIASTLQYEDFLRPVKGDKTEAIAGLDWSEIDFFNTKENSETRNRYREFQRQSKREKLELADEDKPTEPDARTQNGVILTSMRHDRNHNALWKAGWDIQQHFGALVASVFKAFAEINKRSQGDEIAQATASFKAFTGTSLPAPASAVKIFFPTSVQGVNRLKADTNKVDGSGQKEEWLLLWLIAVGLFEFGIAERIKVSDNTFDWRMVLLEPKDLSLSSYREVLDEVRKFSPPSGAHGVARFDAEMSIGLSKELLKHHPAKEIGKPIKQRSRSPSIKEMVSGFSGTHFGSKGQVYGVKEVFSLGLPDWIRPETAEEVKNYQSLLDEHLAVVRSLSIDEGNGELLNSYRDFITGNDLNQFFRFNISYADYIVRQLADPKAKYAPKRFSQEGLDIMTRSFDKADQKWSIKDITQNKGFLRIARAINSATVYAGKIKTREGTIELDWQRTYGLAQRLSNQLGSKQDFIAELSAFLTSYDNENMRISEQLLKDNKSLRRVWVTNEDLEQFLVLLDDGQPFKWSLVANLLLAYGYAKWKKPLEGEPDGAPSGDDDNTDESA